jgi:mono/diheme cytochrome c family protein
MTTVNYIAKLAGGAALLSLFLLPARAQSIGETLFKAKCAVCHGADGDGETAMGKANKLRELGSADVQKLSDTELAEIIAKGRNKMPAYGKSLKPEQIKELVGYILNFAKKS